MAEKEPETKHFWTDRHFWYPFVPIFFLQIAYMIYWEDKPFDQTFVPEGFKAALSSLLFGILGYFISLAKANNLNLDKQSTVISRLESQFFDIAETERLILATAGNAEKQLLVMCADINTPNPKNSSYKSLARGKWACTVSILNVSAFQDLLLTPDYMDHFLAGNNRSKKQIRIIVTNRKLKHLTALVTFLKISSELDIETYIFYEEDFFRKVDEIERSDAQGTGVEIGKFFRGMGELNLSTSLESLNGDSFSYFVRWKNLQTRNIDDYAGGKLRKNDKSQFWNNDEIKTRILIREIVSQIGPFLHDDHKVSGDIEKIDANMIRARILNPA